MFDQDLASFNPKKYLMSSNRLTYQELTNILNKEKIDFFDLSKLLSSSSTEYLENIAQKAREKTIKRFGFTMQLYTPLYLSNECVNNCPYCSFKRDLNIQRKTLSLDEVERECRIIKEDDFDNILLVSGEDCNVTNIDYIKSSIKIAKKYFSNVSIEIYPMDINSYRELKEVGLDGVTLYQETYDRELYNKYHRDGPKSDYQYRVNSMDRVGEAGIKKINIGSLLGLNDFKEEALYLAFHLSYLKKDYWQSEYAISFPRINLNTGKFIPPFPVNDIEIVKMILALRIFDEQISLVLSTRESKSMRNALVPLGITTMSAGSKTNPGGHIGEDAGTQFSISDKRSPKEVSDYLASVGYDPVWKDWERGI